VSYNMILHMILPQCCFWTKWTSKFLMSKLNWHILQCNKRQSSNLITCLEFISHLFMIHFYQKSEMHCSIIIKKRTENKKPAGIGFEITLIFRCLKIDTFRPKNAVKCHDVFPYVYED